MERIYPDLPGSTPDLPSDLPPDLPGSCPFTYSSSTHVDMHVNFFLHELRLLADAAGGMCVACPALALLQVPRTNVRVDFAPV